MDSKEATVARKAKKSDVATTTVYQLKITLSDFRPLVWRRVQVADCTLDELHYIIQACMGWDNSHLHAFVVDRKEYGEPDVGGFFYDSASLTLSEIASEGPKAFKYEYDFGDCWRHVVKIEKILPADPETKYPRCTAGKRACPPDDCGGVYGYKRLLDILQNPENPEDPEDEECEEELQWLGKNFDPEAFDIDAVNRKLKRMG
jgi:hypothetical protein